MTPVIHCKVIPRNRQEGMTKAATALCNSVPSIVTREADSVLLSLLGVKQGEAAFKPLELAACSCGNQQLSSPWTLGRILESSYLWYISSREQSGDQLTVLLTGVQKNLMDAFCLWKFSVFVTQESCGPKDANEVQLQQLSAIQFLVYFFKQARIFAWLQIPSLYEIAQILLRLLKGKLMLDVRVIAEIPEIGEKQPFQRAWIIFPK